MSTPTGFGSRVAAAVAARGHLCVGLDPHPELLDAWGLAHDAAGVDRFCGIALEAFGERVAAVKPQVALFEEYGSAGLAVLERVLGSVAEAGALSVADAKRGDIGSTMSAYARAWLADASPLASDAVTVNPYLGLGALDPAFRLAAETGRGVFVLARTSNPEASALQTSRMGAGSTGASSGAGTDRTVAEGVVAGVAARNRELGALPGPFGVVVGATVADPPELGRLGGPVLMPGVGAQGATPADAVRIAGGAAALTLVNVSREVLRRGPDVAAMRAAADELTAGLRLT